MSGWDDPAVTELYPSAPYTTRQFTMTKEKVGSRLPIGMMDADFRIEPDYFLNMMTAQLTAFVLTDTLANDTVTESAKVPDGWWDHLKHDAWKWADGVPPTSPAGKPKAALRCDTATFVRWWVRRHPVQFRTVTLTATWTRKDTRPESRIRVHKDLGRAVFQEAVTHNLRWDEK